MILSRLRESISKKITKSLNTSSSVVLVTGLNSVQCTRLVGNYLFEFSSISKQDELPTCPNRAKFIAHYKALFNSQVESYIAAAPSFSLGTSSLIFKNMNSLDINSAPLREALKKSIESKLATELSPETTVPLLTGMCEQLEGDESRLLQMINDYLKENFFQFSFEELKKAEHIFMQSGKFIPLKFDPQLTQEVEYKSEKSKSLDSEFKSDIMNVHGIKFIPKNVGITFNDHEKIFRIQLAQHRQAITFIAIDRNDYRSIKQMKEHLLKERSTRHYIIDAPPFHISQIAEIGTPEEQKQKQLRAMMFGTSVQRDDPESLLKSLQEIPVISGDMIKFYIEEYIQKARDDNRVGATERIVYSKRYGMAEPNEAATFIYDMYLRDKKGQCKVLLAALPLNEEIKLQITSQSQEQLDAQLVKLRTLSMNSQIEWACKAGFSGCVKCGAGIRGPKDLIEQAGATMYDYSFREKNLAEQALAFMSANAEADKFTIFVDKDRQWQVIKYFIEGISEKSDLKWKQLHNSRGIQLNQIRSKINAKEESVGSLNRSKYIENYAKFAAYFPTHKIELPFLEMSKEEKKFYEEKLKAASFNLHPDSCYGEAKEKRLKKSKIADSCFAQDLLSL